MDVLNEHLLTDNRQLTTNLKNAIPEPCRVLSARCYSYCGSTSLLKLRRHTRLVPSIMFGALTDEDQRANVPFQRLRNLLLPLLQVLFLFLLIVSVARPRCVVLDSCPEKQFSSLIIPPACYQKR